MRKRVWMIALLWLTCMMAGATADTLRVLCIGNSFTYVDSAHVKLCRIAESQGHVIKLNAQLQGGYTLQRHMRRDETMSAIIYYEYDHVFLQDQSRTPALYAENAHRAKWALKDTKEMAERVRMYSPNVQVWVEQTWAYSAGNYGGWGSYETFDTLLKKGTRRIAQRVHARVSPIGEAFKLCRERYPDIDLYSPDRKHQSAYGSYLKASVNYLMLYGDDWGEAVSNCGLDPEQCSKLRTVAELVVRGKK